jgi:hypothetical protein
MSLCEREEDGSHFWRYVCLLPNSSTPRRDISSKIKPCLIRFSKLNFEIRETRMNQKQAVFPTIIFDRENYTQRNTYLGLVHTVIDAMIRFLSLPLCCSHFPFIFLPLSATADSIFCPLMENIFVVFYAFNLKRKPIFYTCILVNTHSYFLDSPLTICSIVNKIE